MGITLSDMIAWTIMLLGVGIAIGILIKGC